jgi:hypothetical protein
LSHEEKQLWLKLSMEGQPSSPRREQMGGRKAGVGWLAVKDKEGAPWGAVWREWLGPFAVGELSARSSVFVSYLLPCVRERRKHMTQKKEEKRRKK